MSTNCLIYFEFSHFPLDDIFTYQFFCSVLSCEEDDESMEDEDFKPVPNPINSKYGIEKEANSSTRDNLLQKNTTNNDSAIMSNYRQDKSDSNKFHHYKDDIKIIDLEARVEDGSVSSYGRSTSDSPNETLHSVGLNEMPSTSASYLDQEHEPADHSDQSSSLSPKESQSRYYKCT